MIPTQVIISILATIFSGQKIGVIERTFKRTMGNIRKQHWKILEERPRAEVPEYLEEPTKVEN